MALIEVWGTHPPDNPENIKWADNVEIARFMASTLGHVLTSTLEVGEYGKVPKTILRQIAKNTDRGDQA